MSRLERTFWKAVGVLTLFAGVWLGPRIYR